MSGDMQDVMMDRLERRLRAGGWTFTVDYSGITRGVVRLIDDKTLYAKAGVWFSFTDDGCEFTETSNTLYPVASCTYGQQRHEGHIPSVKSTPAEVLDAVVTFLVDGAQS